MQGCALGLAHAGRDSGAICARDLGGRTGELPAHHGLGSSGREPAAGRSRGQLVQPLDASRQSVILLRRHFFLTISHCLYSNTPSAGVPRTKVTSRFERHGAGKAPTFRLTRYATRALPETRGDLHPCVCQDRSPVPEAILSGVDCWSCRAKAEASLGRDRSWPKSDAQATAGGTADQRDDASALRQNAAAMFLGARLTAVRKAYLNRNPCVNLYFDWDFPKLNI
jgi:hypothetical protein